MPAFPLLRTFRAVLALLLATGVVAGASHAQAVLPFVLQDAASDTLLSVGPDGTFTPHLGLRFADGTEQTTAAASGWLLGGNEGTAPGTHFLGTSDNAPFEVHVNGQRAMRFEPGSEPNVIGGYFGNLVNAGMVGATISGGGSPGQINQITGHFATISGGRSNSALNAHSSIGGGTGNRATGAQSTVSGGSGNTASGSGATVPGGLGNTASGAWSFAAGRQAKANHSGTFVWADGQNADFTSANINTFNVRAANGVNIHHGLLFASNAWPIRIHNPNTSFVAGMRISNDGFFDVTNQAPFPNAFARLSSAGTWTAVSDRRLKQDIIPAAGLLAGVMQLQPSRFRYQDDVSGAVHLGLIAQEVQAVFPEFVTEAEILTLDYAGLSTVALGAIREQQAEIEALRAEVRALQRQPRQPLAAGLGGAAPWLLAIVGFGLAGLVVTRRIGRKDA